MSVEKAGRPKKRRKRNRILTVALLVFAVYIIVVLAQLQTQLNDRKKVYAEQQQQIVDKTRAIADLQDKLDNYEKYVEQQARKQGLARSGELIFQEIPGKNNTKGLQ